ncbi:MAG: branched-chain-amino-acid transaminase [Candidatus Omnitrophica bacterium 4484_49]|nr:branched-chain-amino-acid transaminase [Candidatus Omnitrophota bacterium]OQX83864.1 MAG: branched-chain-amino-acid transaminase [Candidatus Omnitrophica bacterium 4484_49]
MKVYLNGELVDKESALISVFDHGYLYGDGVFEGIRAYNGIIFKLREHLDRLYRSAHMIMLEIPLAKVKMQEAVIATMKANNLKDAYIRVVVSRGEGDLGLDPRKCKNPNVVIITDKIVLYPQELYEKGMEIITVPTRRNIPEAINPQIKSLNYLNNILAKIEAINSGYQEAVMLNHDGLVVECTGDNIFILKENVLLTPPAYLGALKGITRDTVIELARKKGIEVKEDVITRYDLYNAQECFLTGTAAEIVPVVKIDGRVIGNGKPGKITLQLIEDFRELTIRDGVAVY